MQIISFFNKYKIDKVLTVEEINGGLVHKAFKVTTENNIYFVKILSKNYVDLYPNIIDDINKKENITEFLKINNISCLHAIKINNSYITNYNNEYYIVFNFIEGNSIEHDIPVELCRNIAREIAKMHSLDYKTISSTKVMYTITYDFSKYIENKNINKMPYKDILLNKYNILNELSIKAKYSYNKSYIKAGICHKDLKPSNVLWNDNNPTIIDMETVGIWNIYREALSIAIDWSGFLDNEFNENKYIEILREYSKYISIEADSKDIIYGNLFGRLGWLDYNINRSLKMDNEYDIAINEVNKMFDEIDRYINLFDTFVTLLDEIKKETIH